MRKIKEWFTNLPRSKKVQVLLASTFTLALLVVAGVLAWFANQQQIESMTKVKSPPTLNLAAGHEDGVSGVELKGIDVTKGTAVAGQADTYYKDYVFSVEPGKITTYDLQIAHTTNIPFEYSLFRAKEDSEGDIVYTALDETEYKYSIMVGTVGGVSQDITLTAINPDDASTGRVLGEEDNLPSDRKNYESGDTANIYAEPIYSIARDIRRNDVSVDGTEGRDYFVLRLTWTVKDTLDSGDNEWNYAYNNKETDIVYISAQASSN